MRRFNIVAVLVLLSGPVFAQQNRSSGDIASLTIHPNRISLGNGDNWPITWADDGDQYTVYCDGEGFGGGSGKGSMSLARIVGDPPAFTGENLASPTGHKTGGGPKGRKASGLLMVDGVLYMWVRNLNEDGTGSSLAWSEDRANTWTWADWNFPNIGYPTWLNAGRNYAAAQDEFAYFYSPDTASAYKTSDHMIMARVPTSQIRNEKAYSDQFAGVTDDLYARQMADWKERSKQLGASTEEWDAWMEHQDAHDHHATLAPQSQTGRREVEHSGFPAGGFEVATTITRP